MYVDFDLLQYVGTLKHECPQCGFSREHQVDVLKDRYPRQLILTCDVCKHRQAQILSVPVDVPDVNAPEPALTD
jgi:uncharacterized Zn finger protein